MKLLTKIALVLILSLLTASVFLLKGCGNTQEATYGSTITINPTTYTATVPIEPPVDVIQTYRVTVKDPDGRPINGIEVTISGGFAFPYDPTLYSFYNASGGSGQRSSGLGFTGKTNAYGVYSFSISIPSSITNPIADPVTVTPIGTTTAALTLLGQYCYRVSATTAAGETLASAPESCVTLVGAESAVDLSWGAVTGATGYRIYGNRTGIETRMTSVGAVTTFNDDGTPAPGATALPGSNTATLPTPVNAAFIAGAGTLNDGTYYYRVSAITAAGETLASAETSLAVSAGAGLNGVNVNWGAVTGATGYRIYGRTTGAELFIAAVGAVTTFLDDGSVAIPAGALPGTNTATLPAPAVTAVTGALTVSLTPSTQYCYQISAVNSSGLETAASTPESCVTLTAAQNAVVVNWVPVGGAAEYNIYGRSSGAKGLITTVGAVTTWTDNGSMTPSGSPPPAANGTNVPVLNSFTDTIYVSSGTANATSAITFN